MKKKSTTMTPAPALCLKEDTVVNIARGSIPHHIVFPKGTADHRVKCGGSQVAYQIQYPLQHLDRHYHAASHDVHHYGVDVHETDVVESRPRTETQR